jgi:hypothetical protein
MCDPLTIGSIAVGLAGTAANAVGQQGAAKKQQREYDAWAAQQKQARNAENARQEQLRGRAETSRQEGVEAISADEQARTQAAEEARLTSALNEEGQTNTADPGAPASVADDVLTGSGGGGQVFQSDLARKISDATASAKQRIGALARVSSYGDSFGGLGTVNPINQGRAGAGIDAANEMRKGSISAYGAETAIDPVQITYSNPIADIASSFLGAGMQGLGQSMAGGGGVSSIFKGAVKPKVPIPTPRPDPWANMRSAVF